eukprot:2804342-Prymnesium_polylepis.1
MSPSPACQTHLSRGRKSAPSHTPPAAQTSGQRVWADARPPRAGPNNRTVSKPPDGSGRASPLAMAPSAS